MNTSKRPFLIFLLTNSVAVSLVLALVLSCKKTDDPQSGSSTSIQGNWRLTAINVNPAYTDPSLPIPFTELIAPLSLKEPNCITGTTLSFNNGTITNNATSITACTNAALSKQLVNTFFSASTSYTETDNQITIRNAQTVTASKTVTTTNATLITQLPTNPGGQAVPTSYTLSLTRL